MKKLNIYLPEPIHRILKAKSSDAGIRMSELIRRYIDDYFKSTSGSGTEFARHSRKSVQMKRTNIFLTEPQFDLIAKHATISNCTKADVIRVILLSRPLSDPDKTIEK